MPGPAPKDPAKRRRVTPPRRGEFTPAGGVGWKHGRRPTRPSGLTNASKVAWDVWFDAWFAWFWTPNDVPTLRQLIRLYDQVERGEFTRFSDLRMTLDSMGITPKGQQERRWAPPEEQITTSTKAPKGGTYSKLRAVE